MVLFWTSQWHSFFFIFSNWRKWVILFIILGPGLSTRDTVCQLPLSEAWNIIMVSTCKRTGSGQNRDRSLVVWNGENSVNSSYLTHISNDFRVWLDHALVTLVSTWFEQLLTKCKFRTTGCPICVRSNTFRWKTLEWVSNDKVMYFNSVTSLCKPYST